MDYEYYPDDDYEYWDDFNDPNDYYEPLSRAEELSLLLRNTWYRLTHPVYAIKRFMPTILYRFTRCRYCGKWGTMDGSFCRDHWIPF